MDTIKAWIEEASIQKISKLWRKKPHGLRFNDTDALLLTARTEGGATVKEAFYFLLKPDGTFDVDTVNREGCHFRRVRLASLLKHYGMTDDVKHYNLKKEIENWKGREVEVVLSEDGAHIHVPQGGS